MGVVRIFRFFRVFLFAVFFYFLFEFFGCVFVEGFEMFFLLVVSRGRKIELGLEFSVVIFVVC